MKAETLCALKNARDLAMKNTLAARIPECGDFGHIAQDLDYVLNDIEAYTAPPRVVDEAMVLRAAKVLADRSAKECNVDPDDNWNVYSETYIADAEQALKAAIGES